MHEKVDIQDISSIPGVSGIGTTKKWSNVEKNVKSSKVRTPSALIGGDAYKKIKTPSAFIGGDAPKKAIKKSSKVKRKVKLKKQSKPVEASPDESDQGKTVYMSY